MISFQWENQLIGTAWRQQQPSHEQTRPDILNKSIFRKDLLETLIFFIRDMV